MFDNNDDNILVKLQPYLIIGLLLVSLGHLGMSMWGNEGSFPKKSDYLGEDSLALEVCTQGLVSISRKDAAPELIIDKIINLLNKTRYNVKKDVGEFKFDKIFHAHIHSTNKCKVVTQDKKGIRAFFVTLQKDLSYAFNYKISDISEIKVFQNGSTI